MSCPPYWTKQRCLDALRQWALEHGGRAPGKNDWKHATPYYPCSETVARRFGSWTFAVRLAGLQPKGQPMYWNRRRIIASIRWWNATRGAPPKSNDWKRAAPEHPSQSTVRQRFGTWNTAIVAAGLVPYTSGGQANWTHWDVVACIRRHFHQHGRTPTSIEWHRATPGRPNLSAVKRLFGTWNNAIRVAGYVPRIQGENQSREAA